MATQNTIDGDLYVRGGLVPQAFTPPANCIGDSAIPAGAGIQQTKLEHQHRGSYRQPNAAAAAETKVVAVVYGATGTLLAFKAGAIGPAVGADTCSVDLKKNGASVLTAPVSLTSAQAAYALVAGAIATVALVAGDVLTVVVTPNHTSGTLPTGVFATPTWKEDAQ